MEANKKTILVTGGNAGIGFALCGQLVSDHGCKVYMGARNEERGNKAVEDIKAKHPGADI
jgi:NAD(P)-dependent dehydrogenase (short-subunit alcohol dehydrogenase family)